MQKSTIFRERQRDYAGLFCAFVVLAMSLASPVARAANGSYVWARHTPGGYDYVTKTSIALDSSGNLFCAGGCDAGADLDPSPETHTVDGNVFILKLSNGGDFLWAKSVNTDDRDGCLMTVDNNANVILAGNYVKNVDCDPGPGVCLFEAMNYWTFASYIVKLDNSGNFLWAKNFSNGENIRTAAVGTDSADNIITVMSFRMTADFDPGPGICNLTAPTYESLCILKLTSAGDFVWAKVITENKAISNYISLAIDHEDNILFTASFTGKTDFDPGSGVFNMQSDGSEDVFVLKLDNYGNFVWAKSFGGTDDDRGKCLSIDNDNAICVAGTFRNTVDFDPGENTHNLSATMQHIDDLFVVKLDSDGNFIWADAMGGTTAKEVNSIAVNSAGEAYVTGSYTGTVDFDPSENTYPLTSAGGTDMFLFKLGGDGSLAWAQTIGAPGNQEGARAVVDNQHNIFSTGVFSGTVDFDPGINEQSLTAQSDQDRFYLKLSDETDLEPPNAISIVPDVSGPPHAEQVDFIVSFDEAVHYFNAEEDLIIEHAGTAHTGIVIAGGPVEYTVSVTGISGEGSFTLAVSTESDIADFSGNALSSSVTSEPVAIDHMGPQAINAIPSSLGPTNAAQIDFTVSFNEPVHNVDAEEDLIIEHAGTAHTGIVIAGGPVEYTVSVTGISGNGSFTLAVNDASDITDIAGNALVLGVVSLPVSIDTLAPTGTLIIEQGAAFAPSDLVSGALTANDGEGSGVSDMRFSDDGEDWSAWELFAAVKALTLAPPDGVKTVYVQFRDLAGNLSTDAISDDILLDTIPPGGGMQIDGGATYTGNMGVTLSLQAEDGEGSGVSEVRFSEGGEIWGAWEAISATRPWTLPEGDGLKTIYAEYRDLAGHESQNEIFASITLDTRPPEGSIQINGGQAYANSSAVTLTFSVIDEGTGVREMRFSSDGISYTAWEPYAAVRTWNLLSGNGEKTIYVEFRDAVPLTSAPVSASITLDTGDPQFTEVAAFPAQAASGKSVTISFTASEALSEDPFVTINGHPAGRETAKSEYTYSYVVQGEEEDPIGPAPIVISGTDLAGNTGTFESAGILTILLPKPQQHAADQNDDKIIALTELLRVIQFFNSGGFQCAANPEASEDGYLPGPGANHDCAAHSSDYNSQNWQISLTELLRLIQFFNTGGYHPCDGTEDGFCPGRA